MGDRIDQFWETDFITDKTKNQDCCGCANCKNICPKDAISMEYDDEGFLYPKIDEAKCVYCSACLNMCPLRNTTEEVNRTISSYAAYSKNEEIINTTASGGFITELSRLFVKRGGVVYGVRYNAELTRTEYASAQSEREVFQFSSSKYLQSEKKDIFKQIKIQLEFGKKVLVTGCPCDLFALKQYTGKEYQNLYTCELVCMGVTSPFVFEQYIEYAERKHKQKIMSINMRSKKNGWYVSTLEECYLDGKKRYTPFYGSYLGHAFLTYVRPSCLTCHFRHENSTSDFRVGDFWGIKTTDSFWNKQGVSCVFTATEKAEQLIEEMDKNEIFIERIDDYKSIIRDESMYKNKNKTDVVRRNRFAKIFVSSGLIEACRATQTFSFKVKRFVPSTLQPTIKKIYHSIIDRR